MASSASSRPPLVSKLTHTRLIELLRYDPATGYFTRLKAAGNQAQGARAGTVKGGGYVSIKVDNVDHLASRLAWFFVTGEWPTDEIDHRNRQRTDNRWVNLREATDGQNQHNAEKPLGQSGVRGARLRTKKDRWVSQICIDGKKVYLGHFATAEEAGKVYAEAKLKLHPFAEA